MKWVRGEDDCQNVGCEGKEKGIEEEKRREKKRQGNVTNDKMERKGRKTEGGKGKGRGDDTERRGLPGRRMRRGREGKRGGERKEGEGEVKKWI